MPLRSLCASLALLALVACAKPQTTGTGADIAATEAERDKQLVFLTSKKIDAFDRVAMISDAVLVANANQCGPRVTRTFGLTMSELHDINDDETAAALRSGLLSFPPAIKAVVPNGNGTVQPGDRLVAIDGEKITSTQVLKAYLDRADTVGQATATVARAGTEFNVPLVAVQKCDIPVELAWDNNTNAFTDGERIVINRGILDIADNDDEVALVVAHELGHVASGHLDAQRTNTIAGGAVGLIADIGMAALGVNTNGAFMNAGAKGGRRAFSQDFEREADYVGAYFATNAGYSVDAGKTIWRSMGVANPASMNFAGSHPTSPERYVALDAAATEVTANETGRAALQPRDWVSKMTAP